MKKISILGAVSGALVAGSLVLAGPAYAHHGDAGDGSRTPAGQSSTSAHSATEGQIGVGIFTAPAPVNGAVTGKDAQRNNYSAGEGTASSGSNTPAGGTERVSAPTVGSPCNGCELPLGPVGAAPAA